MPDDLSDDDVVDRSEELAQREQDTIYLDLPTPELCDPDCGDDQGWVSVATFTDPAEAVAFIREHIDPSCDEQGRINILSNMPAMPKGDLPRFLAVCKEVASMPGKDWLDGQLKLARAIMEYDGELTPLHKQLAICEYHNCEPCLQRFISKTPIDIDRVAAHVVADGFDANRDQLTFVDEPFEEIDLDASEAERVDDDDELGSDDDMEDDIAEHERQVDADSTQGPRGWSEV